MSYLWCARLLGALVLAFTLGVAPMAQPASAAPCFGLRRPVPGAVLTEFAPTGRYSGHWGVDFDAVPGERIVAAAGGIVSFAGTVAGNLAVTIDHGGGLKTSYSYLEARWVSIGHAVATGQPIGLAGPAHGDGGLHFSVRIAGGYVDPAPLLACRQLALSDGLRLIPDSP